jgi:type III secretory pathway component EscS
MDFALLQQFWWVWVWFTIADVCIHVATRTISTLVSLYEMLAKLQDQTVKRNQD